MSLQDEKDKQRWKKAEAFIKHQKKKKEFIPKDLSKIERIIVNLTPVSSTEKIFFTQNLGLMVKSGIALNETLTSLINQTKNKRFQYVLHDLRTGVEKGQYFSDMLEKHPHVFSKIFVSMVRAGEKSGKLEESLKTLACQMKKDHTIVTKVKGAMIYPIIVIVAMAIIGVVMMIMVVPNVTSVFAEGGAVLPLPTRVLIGISDVLIKDGIFIGAGVLFLAVLLFKIAKTQKGKRFFHKIVLIIPILAPIVKKINLARFSRTLSSLLKTDMPIVETLHIVSDTLNNVHYKQVLINTAENITKGTAIAAILEKSEALFPPVVTQMIYGGEQSGNLSEVLDGLADFYEEEVDVIMTNLPTIIEPVLILILGVGVGFFAIAIMLPIFSISSGLGT